MPPPRRVKSVELASPRKGTPAAPNSAATSQPSRSLAPLPMLLAVLSVVFALWMAFLVYLYFKTPRPRSPAQSQSAASPDSLLDPLARRLTK